MTKTIPSKYFVNSRSNKSHISCVPNLKIVSIKGCIPSITADMPVSLKIEPIIVKKGDIIITSSSSVIVIIINFTPL